MNWMIAAGNAPFVIALLIMAGIALVELAALLTGLSINDAVDNLLVGHVEASNAAGASVMDSTAPSDSLSLVGRFLSWLHIGKVPVLMVLIVLLTVFGVLGLVGQGVIRSLLGYALPAVIAAPAALFASLPLVRASTGVLARLMPRDETSAVDIGSLLGRTAVITGGTARRGTPAQARVRDGFGTEHYLLVEPEDDGCHFPIGSVVLLVRQQDGSRFTAIENPNAALVDP